MKLLKIFTFLLFATLTCSAQEKSSSQKFESITLLNKIEFVDSKFDQPKFSCAFLLQYKNTIYAVTAKHLLQIIRPPEMKALFFKDFIRKWTMFPMDKNAEIVSTGKLLNENSVESLTDKNNYNNDWLVFSIAENKSLVRPLSPRLTPLKEGEKLYVIGWIRKMEEGPQRVYEFEYYKTIGQRILLKDILVPETLGGLSGAPLIDADGLVVGLVSNGTVDPVTGKKYFSPCSLQSLLGFLDTHQ